MPANTPDDWLSKRERPATSGPRPSAAAGARHGPAALLWLMINLELVKRTEEFVPSCGNHQLYPPPPSRRWPAQGFSGAARPRTGQIPEPSGHTSPWDAATPAFPVQGLTGRHSYGVSRTPVCSSGKIKCLSADGPVKTCVGGSGVSELRGSACRTV